MRPRLTSGGTTHSLQTHSIYALLGEVEAESTFYPVEKQNTTRIGQARKFLPDFFLQTALYKPLNIKSASSHRERLLDTMLDTKPKFAYLLHVNH